MAEKKKTAVKSTNTKSKTKNSNVKNKKNTGEVRNNNSAGRKSNPQRRAIIYFAIAAFLLCLIIIRGQNVWSAVRGFIFGVFGFSSLLLPVFFGYLTYLTARQTRMRHKSAKLWLSSGVIILIDIMFFLLDGDSLGQAKYADVLVNLYEICYNASGPFSCNGGIVSGLFGYPILKACGRSAGIALVIILLLVFILFITGISLSDVFRAAKKPVDAVSNRISKSKRNASKAPHTDEGGTVEKPCRRDEYADQPSLFDASARAERIDIKLDDYNTTGEEARNLTAAEVLPDKEENALSADAAAQFNSILKMSEAELEDGIRGDPASVMAGIINKEKKQSGAIPARQHKNSGDAEKRSAEIADGTDGEAFTVPKEETPAQQTLSETNYNYPPVRLLKPSPLQDDVGAMNELQSNAAKLINTLKSFGVGASIINISRGPSVTRYELQPASGVKISKITNLADDIALNLAANGVRIEAPIPGKAAVGIEVPNKMITTVSMRELIDSEEFRSSKSKLTSVLGKDLTGNIVLTDLAQMPHLLIAGTTGSGKSVCVNSILLSILYKARPDEVKLLLIDPKMVEFSKYKGIPHLLVPVVSDAKKAAGALNWAVSEMLQRYKMFSEYDCKNIHAFNRLVKANLKFILENSTDDEENCMEVNGLPVPKEKMPQIVIAIDELADLMMAAPNEVEESICRLAQMARAAGMHLVIATQRPSVNVITGVIKANIPSRIALKVSSQIDSRTILDFGGAEKLIGRGDMLFSPVGAAKPVRVQGCYASDEEIEKVTGYIKKNYNAQYNGEIEEKIRRIAAEDINSAKNKKETENSAAENEMDSKMEEAIRCVIEAGQASTSMLQRKIKVGYARAGRMIDDMEQMGIVGPYQGSKPRDVLMTYNEWLERSNILGDDLHFDPSDDE